MSGPKRFTTYIGSEKFKPAEGYFAVAEIKPMYTDEHNDFYSNGYHIYISPYYDAEDPEYQTWADIMPIIVAAVDGVNACILVHYYNGDTVEGGVEWEGFWYPEAGQAGVGAYQDGQWTGHYTSNIEYVKIYAYDYDSVTDVQPNESWWDSHATLIAQLGVEYDASTGRYVWTM